MKKNEEGHPDFICLGGGPYCANGISQILHTMPPRTPAPGRKGGLVQLLLIVPLGGPDAILNREHQVLVVVAFDDEVPWDGEGKAYEVGDHMKLHLLTENLNEGRS